jgi:hypothetical protein
LCVTGIPEEKKKEETLDEKKMVEKFLKVRWMISQIS